jgi:HSP20 family protein
MLLANLHRWDPFTEMNRLFEGNGQGRVERERARTLRFVVDVYEEGDSLLLEAELPGLRAEDVDVTVHDGVLTISGERKAPATRQTARHHVVERSYGAFRRAFVLPDSVDPEKIEAKMNDGVLVLKLAKKAEVRPRKIAVNGDASA